RACWRASSNTTASAAPSASRPARSMPSSARPNSCTPSWPRTAPAASCAWRPARWTASSWCRCPWSTSTTPPMPTRPATTSGAAKRACSASRPNAPPSWPRARLPSRAAPRATRCWLRWRAPARGNRPSRHEARRSGGAVYAPARDQSAPDHRTRLYHAVRAAGGRGAVRAGHRRGREQGHAQALPGGEHAAGDRRPGRGRAEEVHQHDRPVQRQGQERGRAVAPAARAPRRQGAAHPRGTRSAARRGPQDRQRHAQHGIRRADHRGGHAHLPRRQPYRSRPRQGRARGGRQAGESGARRVQKGRPPLADPARPLRVHRAQAALPGMHHPRPVPLQVQDRGTHAQSRQGTPPRGCVADGLTMVKTASRCAGNTGPVPAAPCPTPGVHAMRHNVLIIGAGPVGLRLSLALAKRGMEVDVVERQSAETLAAPAYDGREIALTQASMRLLRTLGVWPHIVEDAIASVARAHIMDGADDGFVVDAAPLGRGRLGVLASNHAIRAAAWQAVAAEPRIRVHAGVAVERARTDAVSAHVHLADGSELEAALLVAADSRFSETRRGMGIPVHMHDMGMSMLLCRVQHAEANHGTAWEWFGQEQTRALLPLRERLSSVVLTVPDCEAQRLQHLAPDALAEELAARYEGRLG